MTITKQLYHLVLRVLPDALAVRWEYRRKLGRWPDLSMPRTLNEKVNWRKLHQRDPRFVTCSDKEASKEFVASILGEGMSVPTLCVCKDEKSIPFDQLEPPYVVKCTHSSGDAVLVRTKDEEDRDAICRRMRWSLDHPHHTRAREWAYGQITPRVMVERMVQAENGESPLDHRFYVFHGRTECVVVSRTRGTWAAHSFFDSDFRPLPVKKAGYEEVPEARRPIRFEEMRAAAEAIGSRFDFIRVDMYSVGGRFMVGELTVYPYAGYYPFDPPEWDLTLGRYWKVSGA